MSAYLLHGLWPHRAGLCLWLEQVEGHKIIAPEQLPANTLPPIIEQFVRERPFRHRVPAHLRTPKGKTVQLAMPATALTPEQAVTFLAKLASINVVTDSANLRAAIAPDLVWILHLYRGVERFVDAGRLGIKVAYHAPGWFAEWTLLDSPRERAWLERMQRCAPGVITINGAEDVAWEASSQLVHGLVTSKLAPLREEDRTSPWHYFSTALLHGHEVRRGNVQELVKELAAWRASMSKPTVQLVCIVEEPETPDELEEWWATSNIADSRLSDANPAGSSSADESQVSAFDDVWAIRIQVRIGGEQPQPVREDELDAAVMDQVRPAYEKACRLVPLLAPDRTRPPGSQPLARSAQAGDLDAYCTTEEIADFVERPAAALADAGIPVLLPRSWTKQPASVRLHLKGTNDRPASRTLGLDQLVSFDWRCSVGDMELSEDEMHQLVEQKSGLVRLRDQWVYADSASLRSTRAHIEQLVGQSKKRKQKLADEASMQAKLAKLRNEPGWEAYEAEAQRLLQELEAPSWEHEHAVALADLRELSLQAESTDTPIAIEGSPWYAALAGAASLESWPDPTPVEVPATVHAALRDYQLRGVAWLHWMSAQGLGAILADDMGLGKTLQLLTLEAVEREVSGTQHAPDITEDSAAEYSPGPTLVVAPTSVVGNWQREAARFVPSLKVVSHHGAGRASGEALSNLVRHADLVVTSYGVLTRDVQELAKIRWERVVLDEAQHIKNSGTRAARAARSLPARHRVALTGTPVENRLAELYSLLDFCNPGMLGSASAFRTRFSRPIERYEDEQKAARLRELTAPFLMRRLKTDPGIAEDLPKKTEQVLVVDMTPEQASLYGAYVEEVKKNVAAAQQSIERRGVVLSALTKIKQICNHPAHFLADGSPMMIKGRHRSGKVAELARLVDTAREKNERMLIFTQYRAFGDLLVPYLSSLFGQPIPFLHGGVSKAGRDRMVRDFQREDGPPAILLSLRAGGTGLNLTSASMVVHMDRWWNPAVETQATDRAYRIGQPRDVTVYKMMTAGTLEEAIQDVLDGKLKLADSVVTSGEGWLTELSTSQLSALLDYQREETDV